MVQRIRYIIFLRDVLKLALTSFGGPQAHLAYFQRTLVEQRKYITGEELMELNSLCQILPGPSSTQTLTAVGYKIGGPNLAYLTLLVWSLPSILLMALAGIFLANIQEKSWSLEFTRFIQPMAVGFVSYAAYSICLKTIHTKTGVALMIAAAVISYFIQTPFVFPAILLAAGLVTAFKYKKQPRQEKKKIVISWSNFFLWIGVLIAAAVIGALTGWLPVRLFENFYRNGSLIFGGGQVLTPLLYTEFVQYAPKQYLSPQEFLSGYAIAQTLPGPVFSFSAFIGALAMREYGVAGELTGALLSAAGIFLPGTFLIFFVIRFWESLKSFRPVRASLEGITAASAGLVVAAAVILFQPLPNTITSLGFTIGTFALLTFTRLPHPVIIIAGLVLGLVLK
ncbi:MAG: chromate efflux transporter [Cyclobacteriaceae bacterium]|nr:chromate efflux transporter [Cyclobacteriaceae bacterium]MCX7636545.1 chromate efflux transporter [Cyclobacteriaceae bacterium]MDW8330559.1 chromate efflux transporter [Cyclobacteriaceae bacterium]